MATPGKKKTTRTSAMSSLWAAFLDDEPDRYQHTVIIGLAYLESDLGMEACRELVMEKIIDANFPRFRSVLTLDKNTAMMTELDRSELDMDYHCQFMFDPSETATQQDVYDWVSTRFDYENRMERDKPLWRFSYVPRLEDGRALCALEVNHALGDGMSQMAVFLGMTDASEVQEAFKKTKKKRAPPSYGLLRRMQVTASGLYSGLGFGKKVEETQNALSVKSKKRHVGIAERIPVAKIKEMAKHLGGEYTVNDILMTLLNLTMTEYFREVDPEILEPNPDGTSKKVTGTFPIDMRPKGFDFNKEGTGNIVSSGGIQFIFDYKSRLELLKTLKVIFDDYKISPAPVAGKFMLEHVYPRLLSDEQYKSVIETLPTKNTSMLSNVQGPPAKVSMKGVQVDHLEFFAMANIALYFGILSYAGSVNATFVCDAESEPDPQRLAKYWIIEFEKFYEEAMAT